MRDTQRCMPKEWVRLQMSGIAPRQEDFERFCHSIAIDPGKERFEAIELYRMIIEAMSVSDDAHYGLCDTKLPLGTWEVALQIMSTALTLREALDLYVAFCSVTSPQTQPSYRVEGDDLIFQLDIESSDQEGAGAAEITNIIIRYSGLCWFSGKYLEVKRFTTKSARYAELFSYCPDLKSDVEFGPSTTITFDRHILDLPRQIGLAPEVLRDSIRWISLVDKMRTIMLERSLPILSAEYIQKSVETQAKQKNIDDRQKRRIAIGAAGLNLRDIAKSVKIYKAMLLLSTTNMSISEISERLEFSEERAFRRFFQSVTALTPSTYRDQFSWDENGSVNFVFSEFREKIDRVSVTGNLPGLVARSA